MKIPPRPPGVSRAEHAAYVFALNAVQATHRTMSDARELWRLCPQKACQRAHACRDPDPRTCFRAFAEATGDTEIWCTFYRHMAEHGPPLLPWAEMAEVVENERRR